MLKTNTKKFFFILLLLVMVEIMACCTLFIIIKKNVHESNDLKAQVNNSLTVEEQNHALALFFNDNKNYIDNIEMRVIPQDGSADFIDSIERLAKSDNISIQTKSVALVDSSAGKQYENLKLGITIQGSWSKIYTFISLLEELPYKVSIKNTSLQQSTFVTTKGSGTSTQSSAESFWTADINFETLKQR